MQKLRNSKKSKLYNLFIFMIFTCHSMDKPKSFSVNTLVNTTGNILNIKGSEPLKSLSILLQYFTGNDKNDKSENKRLYKEYVDEIKSTNKQYPNNTPLTLLKEEVFTSSGILEKTKGLTFDTKPVVFTNEIPKFNTIEMKNTLRVLGTAFDFILAMEILCNCTTVIPPDIAKLILGDLLITLKNLRNVSTEKSNYIIDKIIGNFKEPVVEAHIKEIASIIDNLLSLTNGIIKTKNYEETSPLAALAKELQNNENSPLHVKMRHLFLCLLGRTIDPTLLICSPFFLYLNVMPYEYTSYYIEEVEKIKQALIKEINGNKKWMPLTPKEKIIDILKTCNEKPLRVNKEAESLQDKVKGNKFLHILYLNYKTYVPIILYDHNNEQFFCLWVSGEMLHALRKSNENIQQEWTNMIMPFDEGKGIFETNTCAMIILSMAILGSTEKEKEYLFNIMTSSRTGEEVFKMLRSTAQKNHNEELAKILDITATSNNKIYQGNFAKITTENILNKNRELELSLSSGNVSNKISIPQKNPTDTERIGIIHPLVQVITNEKK